MNLVLLRLAEEAELVERDGEGLAPGEDAGWLDDLADDSDALDAWEYTSPWSWTLPWTRRTIRIPSSLAISTWRDTALRW